MNVSGEISEVRLPCTHLNITKPDMLARSGLAYPAGLGFRQATRWRTSQTVAAISSSESTSSQPPSMNWNGQNRAAGW
jgi:hypothetical protein